MKYQANRDYKSNDDIMTSEYLVEALVKHFKPTGKVLEPCKSIGNFLKFLPNAEWCKIRYNRDFFDTMKKYDWIITNPPWSQVRKFLKHSMELASNVVFLMTINHLWTKARLRDIEELDFGIREICLIDTPKSFPQLGFQLGAIYLKKDYKGQIKLTKL